MRIFTYILGIIFILFSIVQFNDPDAVIWIIIYLIPAIISFLFTHRKISRLALLILSSAYLIGAIFIFPPSISDWIYAEERKWNGFCNEERKYCGAEGSRLEAFLNYVSMLCVSKIELSK